MAMTEVTPFDVLGAGAGGPQSVPSPWNFGGSGWIFFQGGAVLGAPSGGYQGAGSLNLQSFFINGTKFDSTTTLLLTGGTLTGPLILQADPTASLGAATKNYVDNAIAGAGGGIFLPLSGGTLTGLLTLSTNPTANLHAAPKQYVDSRTPITVDAPNDGQYYTRHSFGWTVAPGGLVDAPNDTNIYGRLTGTWSSTYDAGTF